MNLEIPLFDYANKIASYRHMKKRSYQSCRQLSDNYELVGVLGELVYGYITNEISNQRTHEQGDCGFDFSKRVQVKASEQYKAKHLIEFKDADFTKFDYYVFVVIDLKNKIGNIVGWISVSDFLNKAKEIDFGYGERLAIELSELNKWAK